MITLKFRMLREFRRHFRIYFIVSTLMVMLFTMVIVHFGETRTVAKYNLEVIDDFGPWKFSIILAVMVSFIMATLSSLLDILVLRKIFKRRALWVHLLVNLLGQGLMIYFIMDIADRLLVFLLESIAEGKVEQLSVVSQESRIIILTLIILLGKIFIELDKKLGPGVMIRMLSGRFYKPREVERIFMFVDLKDATPLAVKMGNLQFSKMIQDCFHDFSIVSTYGADIYQYVGDEAVISWKYKIGFKNDNFLYSFFAFSDLLEKRKDYYMKHYGLLPYFKAGANAGKVIVTEVGDIKQELSYHGDTLNTAARIQGKCNAFGAQLLIPQILYDKVKNNKDFQFEKVGSVALKGKEEQSTLYKVSR
ncbi:MAG: adenylate/guanylate cyclase domain-containing protein [Flavobacteriales bacterium]|nr:adenylate/guanylate cyclase domain-containing protein [Flavobacteriales bacterium]